MLNFTSKMCIKVHIKFVEVMLWLLRVKFGMRNQ